MIAHPERCRLFAVHHKQKKTIFDFSSSKRKISNLISKKIELINYLKEIGCAFQCNIGSFSALYGIEVQQTANYLRENKICTHFGTDAHSLNAVMHLFPKLNH
jgi:tyrosine-protein phosphatase YwqE